MPGPLDGIKVLDLTRVLAGPWCTMTLADLGAEIWKVEAPAGGDETRKWSPPGVGGIATYYLAVNRNKRSVAIDLASERGRELIRALAGRADVLVENFLPRSLKRLGLDYESLAALNPRLVHCSISGYGRDGDLADRPGYDFVMQAECGLMAITGSEESGPLRFGVAITDLVSGMNAVQAIVAALYERMRTGRGQSIDVSLYRSGLQLLANIGSGFINTGVEPRRFGNAHGSIVPYQTFGTSDGLLALAVGNDDSSGGCAGGRARPARPRRAPRLRQRNKLRAEHRRCCSASWPACSPPATPRTGWPAPSPPTPAGRVHADRGLRAGDARRGERGRGADPTLGTVRLLRSPLRFSESGLPSPPTCRCSASTPPSCCARCSASPTTISPPSLRDAAARGARRGSRQVVLSSPPERRRERIGSREGAKARKEDPPLSRLCVSHSASPLRGSRRLYPKRAATAAIAASVAASASSISASPWAQETNMVWVGWR
ncbi:MAG: CoA transferase [Dongiaceae bacterium]